MVILLEGPDCAGKSTLAKTVFKDYKQFHFGAFPTPEAAYEEYHALLDSISPNDDICIDRMHISENIYGRIYHGFWASGDVYDDFDRRCDNFGTITVCCLPPLELVLNQWSLRLSEEMIQDARTLCDVYSDYAIVYRLTRTPVVFYDYTNSSYNEYFPIKDRILMI